MDADPFAPGAPQGARALVTLPIATAEPESEDTKEGGARAQRGVVQIKAAE